MNRFIFVVLALLILFAPGSSWSERIGREPEKAPGTGWDVPINSTKLNGVTYYIGEAFPFATVIFTRGSSFSGELFACDIMSVDPDVDTDECDSLLVITVSASESFKSTARRYYMLKVDAAEGSGTPSLLRIIGTYHQLSSSGSGVGAIGEKAALPVDGSDTGTFIVTNCDTAVCAGTGTLWVPHFWDGNSWEVYPGAGGGIATVSADNAPSLGGNLTTGAFQIDGRDVGTDGAKLDGIEAGATADQTQAEIVAAWEAETLRDASVDGDKLDLIETVFVDPDFVYDPESTTGGIQEAID